MWPFALVAETAVREAVRAEGLAVGLGKRRRAWLAVVCGSRARAKRHTDHDECPKRKEFPQHPDHLLLEPHVLESFRSATVERRCRLHVTAGGGEVALCRPCHSRVTGRGELSQTRLRLVEDRAGFVQPPLLEQRSAEHDLRVADFVQEVDAPVEKLERVARLLLGELVLLRAQM